jgi:serine/threonine protein kinase
MMPGATMMPRGGPPSIVGRAGLEAAITLDQSNEPMDLTRRTVPQVLAANADNRERYVEEEVIGQGGMATVVRAVDCDIRREVALKTMLNQTDARARRRFVEEAQITGQLEHPNICPVHELGIDDRQRLFLSMKLVKGQCLAQVLQELRDHPRTAERRFTLSRLVSIFVAVCNAMAYAHSRGVIHRDLKPANIMIGDFGEVYVMDWGLARVLAGELPPTPPPLPGAGPEWDIVPRAPDQVVTDRDQNLELTRDGAVVGTPTYMSPEQAFADLQAVDRRSDVYSLGVILYELLTLEPPHDRTGGIGAVLARVRGGKIVPPAERAPERARAGKIPAELSAIALKAMSKNPADRYRDAGALKQDVELFLEGRSVSAKEDSWRELVVKFVRRNKGLTAAAALVLATLVVGGAVSYWRINEALKAERKAREDYERAQNERDERTRRAVPAMMVVARQHVEQRELDMAMEQVNLALQYDEKYPDALLLRAQLRLANRDFNDAWGDLQSYQKHLSKPDPHIAELSRLSEPGATKDATTYLQIARVLDQQKVPVLAEVMLRHIDPNATNVAEARKVLLTVNRERIEKAWKGHGPGLTLDANGSFALTLKGQDVRDLTPLKGMLISTLELNNCPNLQSLESLQGVPLESLRLVACPAVRDLNDLKSQQLKRLLLVGCTGLASLSGLENLPVDDLIIETCPVSDLSPLKNLPLTSFSVGRCTQLRDLSALNASRLTRLLISECPAVTKLPPLAGAPVKNAVLHNCQGLTDLSALKGLPLTSLTLTGCTGVCDLSPLAGLPLTVIDMTACTGIENLAGLRGMLFLTSLSLNGCSRINDLSDLKGLKLANLDLSGCSKITDLSPLAGMPLTSLHLTTLAQKLDLTPLKGCPLSGLELSGCHGITDLSALSGMKLTNLRIITCPALTDLSGMKGMPIELLYLWNCEKLEDLTGLAGLPCVGLDIRDCPRVRDLSPLRQLPLGVLLLDNCPAIDDLSALKETTKLTSLNLKKATGVRDLSPLKHLPLGNLTLEGCTNVVDLSPLEGTRLTSLDLTLTSVKDLSPLKGVPTLRNLNLSGCQDLHDLGALAGMKLNSITLPPQPTSGMEALRKMATLQIIQGMPVAAFWPKWDSQHPRP